MLVGYGGLILIRFLIVAPNGIHRLFTGVLMIGFGIVIFGNFNAILMLLLLIVLVYIL
jgi:hypothetical protein